MAKTSMSIKKEPTLPQGIPAMLFVEELVTKINPKGRETTDIDFATWLIGIEKDGILYLRQQSCSDLVEPDDILFVQINHCTPVELDPIYKAFKGYSFQTEPDQLPCECYELHHMPFEAIPKDIQSGIMEAFELFERVCPRSA